MLGALLVLAVAVIALHGILGPAAWVVGAAVAFLYWRKDVKRHPRVPCRFCGGGGDHYSRLGGGRLRRPFGDCRFCGGRKAFPRPGLRWVDRDRYDEIKGAIAKGKAKL